MRKVILVFVLVFGMQNTVLCQNSINTNNLIGYWRCLDEDNTELFFWKDVNGKLQVQEISSASGQPLDVITFRIDKNSIFIRTFFMPNSYASECVYTFIDKKTLKCAIRAEGEGVLVYTKVK
jgi:hypothetical protein